MTSLQTLDAAVYTLEQRIDAASAGEAEQIKDEVLKVPWNRVSLEEIVAQAGSNNLAIIVHNDVSSQYRLDFMWGNNSLLYTIISIVKKTQL